MEKLTMDLLRSIKCIPGCANCCPKHCRHLTETMTCDVHPDLLGITQFESEDLGRGLGCHMTPWQVTTYGAYCPPVARLFEERGLIINHCTEKGGIEAITNYQDTMEKMRDMIQS
jgi:hypothetical protein